MVTTPRGTEIYTREEALTLFGEAVDEGMEFLVLERDGDGPLQWSATFIGEYRELEGDELKHYSAHPLPIAPPSD
jgi:hypothetical protein